MCEAFRKQSFLYTLTAKSARVHYRPRDCNDAFPYTIHVNGLHRIIKFTDREEGVPPIFETDQTVCGFVQLWKREEGSCNFAALPPNGVLTYRGRGPYPHSVGVVLENAVRVSCDEIVFRAAMYGCTPTSVVQFVSLFIDGSNAQIYWYTGAITALPFSWTSPPFAPGTTVANNCTLATTNSITTPPNTTSTLTSTNGGQTIVQIAANSPFWVDAFNIIKGAGTVIVSVQLFDQGTLMGTPLTFSETASGTTIVGGNLTTANVGTQGFPAVTITEIVFTVNNTTSFDATIAFGPNGCGAHFDRYAL